MSEQQAAWERYERLVACLLTHQFSPELCCTANARITGKISGVSRQLDVLVEPRHEIDNSRRIIVDAKFRTRKIDITHVEAFKGLMEDVGATHGFLISPIGHTEAAEKRAQEFITISLVPPQDYADFDYMKWPTCQKEKCKNGRVFWDGAPEITLGLVALSGTGKRKTIKYVHLVGKCDKCGRFHVKCLTCNELFSLDDKDGKHRCICNMPWSWVTSIETETSGEKSAKLRLIRPMEIVTVDRRPISNRSK